MPPNTSLPLISLKIDEGNTTSGGGSWNALGTVSASSARLLAANPATRLRFVPAQGYTGSLAPAISFHAWDQTSGSNGSSANTSPSGGSTAFSIQTEDASLVVNPLQKIFLPLVRK